MSGYYNLNKEDSFGNLQASDLHFQNHLQEYAKFNEQHQLGMPSFL